MFFGTFKFNRARRGTGTCDVAGVSCRYVGSEVSVKCLWSVTSFHTSSLNTKENLYCHLLSQ